MKTIADIVPAEMAKAMEELRHEDDRSREIPFKFRMDLQRLIEKHEIGSLTKTPDYITTIFLMESLEGMRRAFAGYLSHMNAKIKHSKDELLSVVLSKKRKKKTKARYPICVNNIK